MSVVKRNAWAAYLAAMACALVAYRVGPSWMRTGPAFNVIGASTILAIVLGARWNLPGRRRAWHLFALGQSAFITGDVVAYNYEFLFGVELPFPSLADPLYLAFYPAFIAGLVALIHERNPARDGASIIDALVVTIALATASWVYLIAPYAQDATLALPTKLISIAYPLMDILVIGVALRLAVGAGHRGTAFRLLVAGIGVLVVVDSIYGWKLLHGGYETGGLLDVGWGIAYALTGASALHPSMRVLSGRAPDPDFRLTRRRLAMLAVASLAVPVLIAIRVGSGETADVLVLTCASGLLFGLVVARMSGLVLRHEAVERRATLLHAASEQLVLADSRDAVIAIALSSAQALASSADVARIHRWDPAHQHFLAYGPTAADEPLTRGDFPPATLAALRSGNSVALLLPDGPAGAGTQAVQVTTLFPLILQGRLWGVLLIATQAPLKRPVEADLGTLTATVVLALEGIARADEAVSRRADARLSTLSRNATDVVCILAADTSIQYVSASIERVLGYTIDERIGHQLTTLIHPEDHARVESFLAILAAQTAAQATPVEFRLRNHAEGWVTVESLGTNLLHDENVNGLVLNIRDISDRKIFETRLERLAFHDTLTDLPNRALFLNRIEHALARQRRDATPVGVIFLDLDDFKTVNDSLGHAAGDQLLIQTAQRIAGAVRSIDTPARLGGDEFAVLLDAPDSECDALQAAERILAAIAQPLTIEGRQFTVRASVGLAFSTPGTHGVGGAEDLLRNADVAMYEAKSHGKGLCQIFEAKMHAATLARLEMVADLERALDADEFTLRYQPIVHLATGSVSGFEALLRWEHPDRGTVSPLDFIPLAEDTGLIVPIGRQVLNDACRQAKVLQNEFPHDPPISISVNLSARQLQSTDICDEVRSALEDSAIPPDSLILELTESAMMENVDVAIMRLYELRSLGIRLAIDDFGTGHSSLNYIRQFPVDILKVDKSFLWNSADDAQLAAMTAAIIDLARILELQSTAEGIENPEQLARLQDLGCDLGQGYHFAKPLTSNEARALLADSSTAGVRAHDCV